MQFNKSTQNILLNIILR